MIKLKPQLPPTDTSEENTAPENLFKTANEFSMHIERIVVDTGCTYMDAVLDYCSKNFLEPADITPLISKSLKDKIEMDFQDLNYLPKTARLDI